MSGPTPSAAVELRTRPLTQQLEQRICPYCEAMFQPRSPKQRYCSESHRKAYSRDVGRSGRISGVRHLKGGMSSVRIILPTAEVMDLEPGKIVQVVP